MAAKSTSYVQFKLRVRESLRRKIEKEAEKKDISANAEAVERLEHSFENGFSLAFGDQTAREIFPALKAFANEPNIKLTVEKIGGVAKYQLSTSNPDVKPMTRKEFEDLKRRHGIDE